MTGLEAKSTLVCVLAISTTALAMLERHTKSFSLTVVRVLSVGDAVLTLVAGLLARRWRLLLLLLLLLLVRRLLLPTRLWTLGILAATVADLTAASHVRCGIEVQRL